jgi:hypothetical protein
VVAEDSPLSKGVKQPEHEADHVPPSGAEARNACRCMSTLWASMMYTGTHKLGGMREFIRPYCSFATTVSQFYIRGSVHCESNLVSVHQDATYSVYYISVGSSTCFRC